jgi:hypothetical protein
LTNETRALQRYHSQDDLIWPDSTFNANSTKQNKRERKTWIKEEIEIIKEKEGKQE